MILHEYAVLVKDFFKENENDFHFLLFCEFNPFQSQAASQPALELLFLIYEYVGLPPKPA